VPRHKGVRRMLDSPGRKGVRECSVAEPEADDGGENRPPFVAQDKLLTEFHPSR
jgi:hypothetical protein